jgi:hypothetical protein
MEPTRRGKIARLPRAIREELNHRLDEGDPQKDLVGWLNSLPEVKAVVELHFEAKSITQQNLSEWKQGGYRDWRAQLEAQEIAHYLQEEATTWHHEELPPLVDTLALWLATRLAAETRRIAEAEGEERWKLLRQFSRELAALRRGDLQKQRLALARDRLALARETRNSKLKTRNSKLETRHPPPLPKPPIRTNPPAPKRSPPSANPSSPTWTPWTPTSSTCPRGPETPTTSPASSAPAASGESGEKPSPAPTTRKSANPKSRKSKIGSGRSND